MGLFNSLEGAGRQLRLSRSYLAQFIPPCPISQGEPVLRVSLSLYSTSSLAKTELKNHQKDVGALPHGCITKINLQFILILDVGPTHRPALDDSSWL